MSTIFPGLDPQAWSTLEDLRRQMEFPREGEPRVLVIDMLDDQGQPDRLRLPLYDVLIGDAEAILVRPMRTWWSVSLMVPNGCGIGLSA